MSILTDFGTESQAWFTPGVEEQHDDGAGDGDSDANLLFKFSMPLPDGDHSLHHAFQLNWNVDSDSIRIGIEVLFWLLLNWS